MWWSLIALGCGDFPKQASDFSFWEVAAVRLRHLNITTFQGWATCSKQHYLLSENKLFDGSIWLLSRTANVRTFLHSLFVWRRRTEGASIFLRTHDMESLVHLKASANSSSRCDLKLVKFFRILDQFLFWHLLQIWCFISQDGASHTFMFSEIISAF